MRAAVSPNKTQSTKQLCTHMGPGPHCFLDVAFLLLPLPKFSSGRTGCLIQKETPAPEMVPIHATQPVVARLPKWVKGCCSCHCLWWRRGEVALPCPPPPCFPTVPRASLVQQTYIGMKASGGDSSPQPPGTSLGPSASPTPGEDPWRFGGVCLGLIFIYPSEEVNK